MADGPQLACPSVASRANSFFFYFSFLSSLSISSVSVAFPFSSGLLFFCVMSLLYLDDETEFSVMEIVLIKLMS
jgi:hypothetical protein